jgi:hypothetical protein
MTQSIMDVLEPFARAGDSVLLTYGRNEEGEHWINTGQTPVTGEHLRAAKSLYDRLKSAPADDEVERVARAIHEDRSTIPWEATNNQDIAYRAARVAITALKAGQPSSTQPCPDCQREVFLGEPVDTGNWGWIARCGRRIARLEDCKADGCATPPAQPSPDLTEAADVLQSSGYPGPAANVRRAASDAPIGFRARKTGDPAVDAVMEDLARRIDDE